MRQPLRRQEQGLSHLVQDQRGRRQEQRARLVVAQDVAPAIADLTAGAVAARVVERLVVVQTNGGRNIQALEPGEQQPLVQLDVVPPSELIVLVEEADSRKLLLVEERDAAADCGPRLDRKSVV